MFRVPVRNFQNDLNFLEDYQFSNKEERGFQYQVSPITF